MVVERCRRTKRRQVGKKWEAVLRLVFVENPQTKCSVSVFHRTAGTRLRDSITHTSRGSSPSLFFSQPHGRDTPQPLRNSKKQSWLRLTDLPSASTSAPPTPASASGRMIGTSTLPDPFSRREKKARLPPPRDRPARARDRAAPRIDATSARSARLGRPLRRFFRLDSASIASPAPRRRRAPRRSVAKSCDGRGSVTRPLVFFFRLTEPETTSPLPRPSSASRSSRTTRATARRRRTSPSRTPSASSATRRRTRPR